MFGFGDDFCRPGLVNFAKTCREASDGPRGRDQALTPIRGTRYSLAWMTDTRQQREYWDQHAASDPLWTVLAFPEKSGGRWELSEFMKTGEREIALLFHRFDALGLESPEPSSTRFRLRRRPPDPGIGPSSSERPRCRYLAWHGRSRAPAQSVPGRRSIPVHGGNRTGIADGPILSVHLLEYCAPARRSRSRGATTWASSFDCSSPAACSCSNCHLTKIRWSKPRSRRCLTPLTARRSN